MSKATISVIGLKYADPDLFDGLKVPMELDKETAIERILFRCAEFECLYPDPRFMRWAISSWSNVNSERWEKLYRTTVFEYDPIVNYDRKEEWTDVSSGKGTGTESQWAFNSDNPVPSTKSDSENNASGKHIGRVTGNIGVTTTQALIEEERKVLKFNMYELIAQEFAESFCLMVY